MGAKKEALILKALEERQRFTGRRLLAEAADAAAALVAALRDHAPRGRHRRRSAACAAAARPAATSTSSRPARRPSIMDAFTGYKLVERVLARGDTKSSVLIWGGFQADLRVVPRESLGAAQQYFTGSKAHNIALRDRAIQRGFKLNEYGLYRWTTTRSSPAPNEEGIYAALGLPFVPPELRENRGELAGRRRRHAAAAADPRGPPRRPAHAHHGHRRPRRRRDDGAGGASIAGSTTSRSPITASRWRWPTASTNGARSSTPPRIRALNGRLDGITRARRHRVRHPPRRDDGSRRRLPRPARHRHRLDPFGLQPWTSADDRADPARHREPVCGYHRPSRPAG